MINIRHPLYTLYLFSLYRSIKNSGPEFISNNLYKFSDKENTTDYNNRLAITYNPAFVESNLQEALYDLKNSIFNVQRNNDSASYMKAIDGKIGGVDNKNNKMSTFILNDIIPELAFMGKVGVFIDNYEKENTGFKTITDEHPYIYIYKAEDILSWNYNLKERCFDSILLRKIEYKDKESNLFNTTNRIETYLHFSRTVSDDGISISLEEYDNNDKVIGDSKVLELKRIPFYIFELPYSLIKNVVEYQKALLNVASSDLAYLLRANFPFYVEQVNPLAEATIKRMNEDAEKVSNQEVKTGIGKGRKYPIGAERPAFINPSAEPLIASMKKQESMQKEIKELLLINITNLNDKNTLEAGLNTINLILEAGETFISDIWQEYEGINPKTTIIYPKVYTSKKNEEIYKECENILDMSSKVPSQTFKRESLKKVAGLLVADYIPQDKLESIKSEIDKVTVFETDASTINADHESGLVSTETASHIRGYAKDEWKQAAIDHANRLERIAAAQVPANIQGVSDTSDAPALRARESKTITQQADLQSKGSKATRGEGNV